MKDLGCVWCPPWLERARSLYQGAAYALQAWDMCFVGGERGMVDRVGHDYYGPCEEVDNGRALKRLSRITSGSRTYGHGCQLRGPRNLLSRLWDGLQELSD